MKAMKYTSFLVVLALFASCARNPVTGKRQLAISEEQEISLGQSYDPQVVASMGVYEDQQLQAFLTRTGMQMAKESHRPNLNWTFRIVDSDVVNAFAVPGGYVYFTRGILAHFNNEAEFAGVLGHEIGHVTARHTAAQMRKQQLAQVGLIAGAVASSTVRNNFDQVNQGMQLLFLKFGRDAEEQSDALGVEYSSEQGFDAREMAGFFQTIHRIQVDAGVSVPTFLSTHPDPVNREERVMQLAGEWQQKLPGEQDKVNREGYLQMIDGLVYGPDPRQGFTENGKFYHPELRFQFDVPRGWNLINSPQQVQIGSPEGDAAVIFTLAQGSSPEAAAREWAQQNQMQPSTGGATTVNGLSAYVVEGVTVPGQQQSGNQPQLAYRATFVSYNGNIYNFTEIALATVARQRAQALGQAVGSFQSLSDQRLLNRQPERIQIQTVTSPTTLRAYLKQAGVPDDRLSELAILNGMELNERLAAGSMVKTVRRGGA